MSKRICVIVAVIWSSFCLFYMGRVYQRHMDIKQLIEEAE